MVKHKKTDLDPENQMTRADSGRETHTKKQAMGLHMSCWILGGRVAGRGDLTDRNTHTDTHTWDRRQTSTRIRPVQFGVQTQWVEDGCLSVTCSSDNNGWSSQALATSYHDSIPAEVQVAEVILKQWEGDTEKQKEKQRGRLGDPHWPHHSENQAASLPSHRAGSHMCIWGPMPPNPPCIGLVHFEISHL